LLDTHHQVAHLALKHRQNKHQRMRIVLFIGSPIPDDAAALVSVGKKLRKCNVAVDVVSFGDIDENAEKLDAFMVGLGWVGLRSSTPSRYCAVKNTS
jgi:26S proteasome regulatory subunit N10